MKILIAFLLLLALPKCTQEETSVASRGSLNQEITITLHETIQLTGNSAENFRADKLRVTFTELNDSRCPLNAMCLRAGSAVTQFRLERGQGQASPVPLVIGDALPTDTRQLRHRAADTVLVSIAHATYQVILKQVTPYPCTSCPDQPTPQATIQVRAQ